MSATARKLLGILLLTLPIFAQLEFSAIATELSDFSTVDGSISGEQGSRGAGEMGSRGDGEMEEFSNSQSPVSSPHAPYPQRGPQSSPIPSPISSPEDDDPMEQVTSVDMLSDVKPTDWAYQALKSLIERYGMTLGYPDNTFRGNKPMTRYEFAAALAEVLEKFPVTTAAEQEGLREDLQTLQRLEKEFGLALAKVRDRLNDITLRTQILEDTLFSPTTKLRGQLILTGATGTAAPVVARQRLNLLSSWTPNEVLVTQLEMGNNGRDPVSRANNEGSNLLGSNGELAGAGGLDYVEVSDTIRLSRLHYTFKPISNLAVTIGAKMVARDFIDRNRFANDEAVDFNSSFFVNNPLIVQNQIDRPGGAGAAVNWEIKGTPFTLNALYIAADAENPKEGGFFGDRYQGSAELKYSPDPKWAVRLQYTNASINNTDINAFGVNGEWAYNRTLGIFGRLGVSSYDGFNSAIAQDLDANPWSWALGVTARNFGIPGTLAGVAIGQPFVTGKIGDTPQTNFEAFYNLLVSDNLSLTPALILVTNADNDSSKGTTFEFAFRSVFSF